MDRKTGELRWTFRTKGKVESSPVIAGKMVFAGGGGNLYGLNLADGKEAWRFEAGSAVNASPAIARGWLVIGTGDGALYCFGKGE